MCHHIRELLVRNIYSKNMKKILKWGVIAFVIIMIIGAISGGGKGSNTNNSGTTQNGAKKEDAVAKLNDTVTDKDLAFTATGVTTAKSLGSSYTKKDAQGTFYVVTLNVKNVGKETVTIDSSMIKITDSQGRKFDRSIEGQTAKGLSQGKIDMFLQQVQPGLSVTGDIVFDLPDDATDLKLLVKGGLFGTEKQISLIK